MGLISASLSSAGGVLRDQWKEYFYCDAMSNDTLVQKGKKRTKGLFSGNHGSDNIITNGSVIAVADGQCMIIVDQGQVSEICAEPGEYRYDAGGEPSIFAGNLGSSIKQSFASFGKRITFGGEAPADQRIYFFNTKEITGNKYGTPSPVPYRVVDQRAGIDIDIAIRCFGEYSYRITDPILFYTNVCGNVNEAYTRDQLDPQLKTELLTALQPAFARISEEGIRYSALVGHTSELADALNQVLSKKWKELRGIEIVSFGVSSVKASEEDEAMIKDMQRNAAYTNQNLAAASLVGAQAQAMKDAAKNNNGAAMGFMGMNMAQGNGVNAAELYQHSQASAADEWICPKCGSKNTGRFCSECGTARPNEAGSSKLMKYCPNCGARIEDPSNPPKFCSECGQKLHD